MGCTLPFAEMFFAEKKFRNEGSLTSPFAEIIFAKKQVAELGDILPRTFADIFCNIASRDSSEVKFKGVSSWRNLYFILHLFV